VSVHGGAAESVYNASEAEAWLYQYAGDATLIDEAEGEAHRMAAGTCMLLEAGKQCRIQREQGSVGFVVSLAVDERWLP